MSWMEALGEALRVGGGTLHELRNEEEDRARRDRLDQQAAAALEFNQSQARQANERAAAAEGRAVRGEKRDVARDILEALGPNAVMDPETASTVQEGGFGARLRAQEEQLPSANFGVNPSADARQAIDFTAGRVDPGQVGGFKIVPTTREQAQLDAEKRQGELFGLQKQGLVDQQAERAAQQEFRAWALSPEGQAASSDVYNARATSVGAPQRERSIDEMKDVERFKHGLEMARVNKMYPEERFTKGNQWIGAFNDILGRQLAGLQDIVTEETTPEELQQLLDNAAARAEMMTTKFLGPNPNQPPPDIAGITAEAVTAIDSDAQRAGSLQQLFKDANTPQGRKKLADAGVDIPQYFKELKRRMDAANEASARDHRNDPRPSAPSSPSFDAFAAPPEFSMSVGDLVGGAARNVHKVFSSMPALGPDGREIGQSDPSYSDRRRWPIPGVIKRDVQ